MEEEKKLYPFKLMPIRDGNQSVQMADLGYQETKVRNGWLAANDIGELMDMYMERLVGEASFACYGRQFPVAVKFISVSGKLPLTVCPDDEIAAQRLDFLGKAKLWYVADASDDAVLYLGFARDVEPADFYMGCRHGELGGMLNEIRPAKGDYYFIAPGTVHSAGGHLTILEVAECSPLDFRIFNWGQALEGDEFDASLNLDEAFDFIDYKKYRCSAGNGAREEKLTMKLTDCPEFRVSRIRLTDPIHIYGEKFGSFLLYTCVEGEAGIQIPSEAGIPASRVVLKSGESVLVPAEVPDFLLVPSDRGTVLLEVMVEPRDDVDPYVAEPEDGEGEKAGTFVN